MAVCMGTSQGLTHFVLNFLEELKSFPQTLCSWLSEYTICSPPDKYDHHFFLKGQHLVFPPCYILIRDLISVFWRWNMHHPFNKQLILYIMRIMCSTFILHKWSNVMTEQGYFKFVFIYISCSPSISHGFKRDCIVTTINKIEHSINDALGL